MSNTPTIYRLHLTTISNTGNETHTYLLADGMPPDGVYPVRTNIDTTFFDYAEALTELPCPVCGAPMRQIQRGATPDKFGPTFICPVNEAELVRDEHGYLRMCDDAKHEGLRAWHLYELARWVRCESCGRPQNVNPLYLGRIVCDDCYNDALGGETA